ncbi:MAG: lysophospholipid acyltransferase family protein [Myxococcales bacterium]|jgi:1-acyl-sn-glycerol-3-phosphate acyltransferase
MTTIRSFINFLFFGVWTAFMVTYAVTTGLLLRDPEFFRRQQRNWAGGLLKFWGVKLEVHGADQVDTTRSYVVMSNHLSYVDIVVLFLALPIIPGFLAKAELTKVPFLSQALRSGGHVIINRKNTASAMQTLDRAAEEVRDGKTVLIFPEGTRGDSDTVGKFKKGGFHLAKSAGVPILPVGLRGSRSIFPRGSLLVRPGKVEVHIGAPVPPDEVEKRAVGEMIPLVRARIIDLSAMPPREGGQAEPAPA